MKRTRIDDNNALLEMLGVVAAAAGVVAVVTLWQPMRRRRNDQCCNVGNRWVPTISQRQGSSCHSNIRLSTSTSDDQTDYVQPCLAVSARFGLATLDVTR